jgi:hypothetical protein
MTVKVVPELTDANFSIRMIKGQLEHSFWTMQIGLFLKLENVLKFSKVQVIY